MNVTHDIDNIKSVIQFAYDLSGEIVDQIHGIFKSVNHPIPKGFSKGMLM